MTREKWLELYRKLDERPNDLSPLHAALAEEVAAATERLRELGDLLIGLMRVPRHPHLVGEAVQALDPDRDQSEEETR